MGTAFFMRESGKGQYDDMKEFWNLIQFVFTAVGGWPGYFLGGCDELLIALVVFVAVDYIMGVMCAVSDKKLSSEVGLKGICQKVLIFLLVGIANILDVQVIGTGSVLLPLQRGREPSGERSTPRTPRAGKNQNRFRAAP